MSSGTPSSVWTEHAHANGRVYWYNAQEKRSVWQKPDELKTEEERLIDQTDWKAYKTGDRTYYVNSVSKERTWTLPPELKALLQGETPAPQPSTGSASPQLGASPRLSTGTPVPHPGPAPQVPHPGPAPQMHQPGPAPQMPHPGPAPPRPQQQPASLPTRPAPGPPPTHLPPRPGSGLVMAPQAVAAPTVRLNVFPASNAGEESFMGLLQSTGVGSDWTWEQTMRNIVTEPLYKSLSTLSERKVAFNKYIDAVREAEQTQRDERVHASALSLRKAFGSKLKPYYSYDTAQKLFGQTAQWAAVANDAERKDAYDQVIKGIKDAKEAEEKELRNENVATLQTLFKTMDLHVTSRWRDVHGSLIQTPQWQTHPKLQATALPDILAVFEEHMRRIETQERARRKEEEKAHARVEYHRRLTVSTLLKELQAQGKIHAGTSWPDIYPLIKDDDRVLSMLGQKGSTPMDLFYDLVDDLDLKLDEMAKRTGQALAQAGFEVTMATAPESFEAKMDEISGWGSISPEEKKLVLPRIQAELARKERAEQRERERATRKQADELRDSLRRLEPDLLDHLTRPFEEVRQLDDLQSLPAWKDASEEVRQLAWKIYVERAQEQRAKAEREKEREKERAQRERQRERDHYRRRPDPREQYCDPPMGTGAREERWGRDMWRDRERSPAHRTPPPRTEHSRAFRRALPAAGIGYNPGLGPRRLDYDMGTESAATDSKGVKRPAADEPVLPRRTKVRYGDDLEEGEI